MATGSGKDDGGALDASHAFAADAREKGAAWQPTTGTNVETCPAEFAPADTG
jgi:hypothetical protein